MMHGPCQGSRDKKLNKSFNTVLEFILPKQKQNREEN